MTYQIKKASELVDLPEKTIRFYESEGLLSSVKRSSNGYRLYSDLNLEELKLLKSVKDLGLPLSETKKLLKGCDHGDCRHSGAYLQSVIDTYLNQLHQKIDQLAKLEGKLTSLRHRFDQNQNQCQFCCNILNQLINDTKGGEVNV